MKKIRDLLVLVTLLFGIVLANSCKKDKSLAVLTTNAVTDITITSGTSGGKITNTGGADITARGVCWSITQNPTVSGSHTTDGTGSGNFTSSITGLTANTKYYVKAYATNSVGTAYGNEVSFTTNEIVVPTVTTTAVSAIGLTTATSGGNVTADGGASVTARGVCWATTANPTTASDKSSDGSGTGTFESALTVLTPGTLYYVRAYATNSAGTAYGAELSFTTASIVAPVLTTTAVTDITLTSASSGGTISSDGGASVTARGVCWAKTAGPTTANDKTSNGTGTGTFTSALTSLDPGSTYYIRAYATNSVGTSYGNELSFETVPIVHATLTTAIASSIGQTTAVSGGEITADGGGIITARGVCWATTSGPTTANDKTTNGSGTGVFASTLTLLTPNTTYYVRAYAVNGSGTAYGNEISFTTDPVVMATVTTTIASTITLTTAVSGGNVTSDGGGNVTSRGVCWGPGANPTTAASTTTNGTGLGVFTSNLTGLTPNTTYHIRAYAINSAGTAYGEDRTFTTNPVVVPILTTTAASAITLATATTGGNISSDGGADVTARGVCYSLTASPTISSSITSDGSGIGSFSSSLTALTAGTEYHVRAYATNSAGTGYGNEITFTTTAVVLPTLTTTAASAITLTGATSGGNITADGGGTVTARGICWATTTSPTTSNSTLAIGSGTGVFSGAITGLTQGTLYYVRAYATNSAGTAYGTQITFNTKVEDIDGNTYNTVAIGSQIWMAENLKTATLEGGTAIANVTDNAAWIALVTPGYAWYDNNMATNKPLYGALYNWYAVNTGNLCMTGWHVPLDEDFKTLETSLGLPALQLDNWGWRGTDQGAQMKTTTGWLAGENGTNTSGFSAVPGGYRYAATGTFNDLGNLTYFWSRTELDATRAWYRLLDGSNSDIYRAATEKTAGKYVRCVKN
jgi:uncharacterized protein (TIGR02145 family)